MIISSANDFKEAARRRVPRFLFDYADGGAYAEHTMHRNSADLAEIALRQALARAARVDWVLPVALWPGLANDAAVHDEQRRLPARCSGVTRK